MGIRDRFDGWLIDGVKAVAVFWQMLRYSTGQMQRDLSRC